MKTRWASQMSSWESLAFQL